MRDPYMPGRARCPGRIFARRGRVGCDQRRVEESYHAAGLVTGLYRWHVRGRYRPDAVLGADGRFKNMNTPGYAADVLAKAEAGGVHGAELAALRRRLQQLGDQQAGRLPGAALEPLADL